MDESGNIEKLPNEVLSRILSFLPRENRLSALLVCKRWLDVFLHITLPPWKIFYIYQNIEYCGLMGSFDVNQDTVNKEYFYYWYERAPNKADFMSRYGDYFFERSVELENKEERKELTIFFLEILISLSEIDLTKVLRQGIEHMLYREDMELCRMIFVDYQNIPIDKELLKKWCSILCYDRPYYYRNHNCTESEETLENRKVIIAWIKARPEMTKYTERGQDYFSH